MLILASAIMFSSPAFSKSSIKYNKELEGFDYPFEVKTFSFNSQKQDLKMRYMD